MMLFYRSFNNNNNKIILINNNNDNRKLQSNEIELEAILLGNMQTHETHWHGNLMCSSNNNNNNIGTIASQKDIEK